MRTRIVLVLLLSALAPAVLAHPGHPAFSVHHTHGPFDIDPIAGLLLAFGMAAVVMAARAALRQRYRVRSRAKR